MRNWILVGTLALAGCSSAAFEEETSATPVVPVEQVINSLKCGLARAVALDGAKRAGLLGATAKVNLAVNVVKGTSVTADAQTNSGIPIFQGASILPSLSFSSTRQRTINSFIDFTVTIVDRSTTVCGDAIEFQDAGFSTWIQSMAGGIASARAGGPLVSLVDYSYESDFVVKRNASASLGVSVEAIKVTGAAGYDRTDVQHLKVTLDAVHLVRDAKTGKTITKPHAVPFFTRSPATSKTNWSHGAYGLMPTQ